MRFWGVVLGLGLTLCHAAAQALPDAGNFFVAPKRWALVVGASRYPELGNLRYARRDAKAVRELLTGPLHFRPESVSLLSDADGETPPTNANIRAELDRLLKDPRLNEGDLFVFYFSGHGIGTPKGDYLAPTDATLANVSEVGLPIREITEKFVKKGLRNVLIIADACRGGVENQFGAELTRLSEASNLAVMLGCQPGRRSYESDDEGHGYFTAALLKTAADPASNDRVSGALWASSIAKSVSESVATATAESYGEADKQIPTAFADDRRDVLLSANIPATFDPSAITQLQARLKSEPTQRQADFFSLYALQLLDAKRFLDAAELLRTIDGLAPLAPAERTLLGTALIEGGRTAEAKIELQRVAESSDSLWSAMAIVSSPQLSKDPLAVSRAARKAYAEIPCPSMAVDLASVMLSYGEPKSTAAFIQEQRKQQKNPRIAAYFDGLEAKTRGDTSAAARSFRRCLDTLGVVPTNSTVRLQLYLAHMQMDDTPALLAICDEAIKAGDKPGWWGLMKATAQRTADDRPGSLATLRAALENPLDPGVLPLSLTLAGLNLPEVAPKILAQCDRFPRSWESILTRGLLDAFKNGVGGLEAALAEAEKYCDDEMALAETYLSTINPIIEDLHDAKAIPEDAYSRAVRAHSGGLALDAEKIGNRDQLWYFLMSNGLTSNRGRQVYELMARYQVPRWKRGELSRDARLHLLIAAFNYGDHALVDALLAPGDLSGPALVYGACDALLRGDEALAAQRIKLAKVTGHEGQIAEAIRAFLERDRAALVAQGAIDGAPRTIAGLALLQMGDKEKAAEFLAPGLTSITYRYDPVTFAGLRALAKLKPELAPTIVSFIQSGYAPVPLTEEFCYVAPGIREYQGEYEFQGVVETDAMVVANTRLKLSVTAAGVVTGRIDDSIPLKGKVDANGNLTGTATIDDTEFRIFAKLAPKTLFQAPGIVQETGWCLTLLNPAGQRLLLVLQLKTK